MLRTVNKESATPRVGRQDRQGQAAPRLHDPAEAALVRFRDKVHRFLLDRSVSSATDAAFEAACVFGWAWGDLVPFKEKQVLLAERSETIQELHRFADAIKEGLPPESVPNKSFFDDLGTEIGIRIDALQGLVDGNINEAREIAAKLTSPSRGRAR